MQEWTVQEGDALRADTFLARHVPGWGRRQAQQAIQVGAVVLRRGARRIRLHKGDLLQAGDRLEIDPAFLQPAAPAPDAELNLSVVYEDAALVVVDKPAGMASTALRRGERNTVASFLLARWPEMAGVGKPLEAGLVHRLDTQTSGLLIAARARDVYDRLRRQFTDRRVDKEYLAVVHGRVVRGGRVDAPIGHDRRHRDRMQVVESVDEGRPATTLFQPTGSYGQVPHGGGSTCSVLHVQIPTGVRHQIRVHLASIGHPVVGDLLYGSPIELTRGRHLLHASGLRFRHPMQDDEIVVESPTPEDFQAHLLAQK